MKAIRFLGEMLALATLLAAILGWGIVGETMIARQDQEVASNNR